jgi:hypothetical protein
MELAPRLATMCPLQLIWNWCARLQPGSRVENPSFSARFISLNSEPNPTFLF